MRVNSNVKLHGVRGPRLPYPIQEAETAENERVYLTADGIAVADGEGILYWVDTIVTTDAGGSRVYDNNAASGKTLSAAYAAKKEDSVIKSWDPPKRYEHGIFVDLTNALVEICYKPFARNLRCTVNVFIPGTRALVSRVTVQLKSYPKNLVSRVTVQLKSYPKNLVSRVTVQLKSYPKNLVSRVIVRQNASRALTCKLYADRTP